MITLYQFSLFADLYHLLSGGGGDADETEDSGNAKKETQVRADLDKQDEDGVTDSVTSKKKRGNKRISTPAICKPVDDDPIDDDKNTDHSSQPTSLSASDKGKRVPTVLTANQSPC